MTRNQLEELKSVFGRHPGKSRGYLHMRQKHAAEAIIALPEDARIKPGAEFTRAVEAVLGYKAVDTQCAVSPSRR